jgi:hypothetical protein
MKRYAGILILLAFCAPAVADFLSEVWGNTPLCHRRDTMKRVGDRIVEFDLSALPEGARIHRAVLRASMRRRDYRSPIEVCALAAGQGEPPQDAKPLSLRPPWYRSFDATSAVREWAANPAGPFRVYFRLAPGWQGQTTTLEIAYDGKAAHPSPRVADLRAVHHDGQTFLTWREHEDIMAGEEPVTIEKLEKKLLPLRGKKDVVYRVYAHDKPITIHTLGDARLVAEVPFVLSAYYLDSIRTIEHPNPQHGEGGTPFIGGARAKRDPVPRYVIAEAADPLPRGSGLYVRTITRPAKTYYAVIAALNGREAVPAAGLGPANSLARPIAEAVALPVPVRQSQYVRKPTDRQRIAWVVGRYNFWLEFPYVNGPRQLQVAAGCPESIDPARRLPLYVHLGAYGGQAAFYCAGGGGYQVMLCPPYDQDDSMFQGRHECLGTFRSYDQGVVHNWAQRRTFALMEWAARQWPTDPQRVTLRGQFCCWALRYPQRFTAVIGDAYGNMAKGREAQKHGWTWGPYPKGRKNWAGVDHWEWMNLCKYVRDNPTKELPYYVSGPYGASHVGDIGPWAWPELFRALHDTKRAFCARWGGAWAGMPPAVDMAARIERDQSLPAFGGCSLDDCPGDGELNPAGVGGDGDPTGNINGYLFWDTETIVDQPTRWEMTVYLYDGDRFGRGRAPADTCTVNITPRRCQRFAARPGRKFTWTNTSLADGKVIQTGTGTADPHGLATAEKVIISKGKNRLAIRLVR